MITPWGVNLIAGAEQSSDFPCREVSRLSMNCDEHLMLVNVCKEVTDSVDYTIIIQTSVSLSLSLIPAAYQERGDI
jgi:hypothetical protein